MTDLDHALREMLSTRAHDVIELPTRLLDPTGWDEDLRRPPSPIDLAAHRSRRSHRALALAGAAAVVILAAVIALVTLPSPRRGASPAAPPDTITRRACAATLPAAWVAAARAATQDIGVEPWSVAGVTAEGGTVLTAVRSVPSAIDLGYLAPGARAVRDLYRAPGPVVENGVSIGTGLDVDVDGTTAVLTVENGHRDIVPRSIVAVDLVSGRVVPIATAPSGAALASQAYVQDGTVYWLAGRARVGADTEVWARNVHGGPARVVARGLALNLVKSAAGIGWSLDEAGDAQRIDRPAHVPTVVARAADGASWESFSSFVTDGRSYAWSDASGAVLWWDATAGHVIRTPGQTAPSSGSDRGQVLGVAGPLVYLQRPGPDVGQAILDTRTGGLLRLDNSTTIFRGASGRLIGDPVLAVTAGSPAVSGLMRLDTATLPALSC